MVRSRASSVFVLKDFQLLCHRDHSILLVEQLLVASCADECLSVSHNNLILRA